MKVCYITHNSDLSGSNQSLLDILTEIKSFTVEPYVILREEGTIENELRKLNIPYVFFPYRKDIKGKNLLKNKFKSFYNRFYAYKIKRYLLDNKIDIVHNNSFVCSIGMEAAILAKIPYICHNREFLHEGIQVELINEKRSFYLLEKADAAIMISNAIYEKYSLAAPKANFYILNDGVNIKKYLIDHQPLFNKGDVNILLAGDLAPVKGQMHAVEAMKILQEKGYHNIHLFFAGVVKESDYSKMIREYIEIHNVKNISFIGFTDLKELRKNSDIVLVCSRYEGLGRVTIEGQLSGCLVIGADAGGTKDIISDEFTGLLYEYGNINDLCNKIIYAIQNPVKMNQIALAGRKEAIEKFDAKKYDSNLYDIYKKILLEEHHRIANCKSAMV